MVYELKLRTIGGSRGVIIPQEVLNQVTPEQERLYLTASADGSYRLTAVDPKRAEKFAAAMAAHEEVIGQYRNTFKELAK